jgi:hypothetical protein
MTGSIVAPSPLDVERPLSLTHDVPTPGQAPIAPSRQVLAALTASPHAHIPPPVPAGESAGPNDVQVVLDAIVPDVEALRRKLAAARPAGFTVTAADKQRHREVLRCLTEASSILAERA